ncbi:NAD(P)H-binding protein [Chondromyces apiculatus]|uniref:Oxidoreductase n=1 Tax=Chondromyces apiculatus DSM 436 TaxID=1192034 RepID=A0A017TC33_9BACT|nr:NAD(P)H-binding protein [Chondromyces apiculatus]EYF06161.1 Oxidoreductase [Chondromyces apiculatus DSM 436]
MATEDTAILAGASGLIGGHLLRKLLDGGLYGRVIALVRRPLPEAHPRLTQRTVSFDALPDDAFTGTGDVAGASGAPSGTSAGTIDVYCALGTTMAKAGSQQAFRKADHDAPLALAEHAVKAGARQFLLVSSVGADAESATFYLRVKGELERDIAALSLPTVHVFQPSLLLGDRKERRVGEAIGSVVARVAKGAMIGGLRKYRPVEADTVARSMVAASRQSDPGRHTYHYDEITDLAARAWT